MLLIEPYQKHANINFYVFNNEIAARIFLLYLTSDVFYIVVKNTRELKVTRWYVVRFVQLSERIYLEWMITKWVICKIYVWSTIRKKDFFLNGWIIICLNLPNETSIIGINDFSNRVSFSTDAVFNMMKSWYANQKTQFTNKSPHNDLLLRNFFCFLTHKKKINSLLSYNTQLITHN